MNHLEVGGSIPSRVIIGCGPAKTLVIHLRSLGGLYNRLVGAMVAREIPMLFFVPFEMFFAVPCVLS